MATVEMIHVSPDGAYGGPTALFLVSFEAGDALVEDDAAGGGLLDSASQAMGPTFDKYIPSWRSMRLMMSASLIPGDGLAVPDAANVLEPLAVASTGHSLATSTWTFNTVLNLNSDSTPGVELNLLGSTDANAVLDAADAWRIMVNVFPQHNGLRKAVFGSLPETAIGDGTAP